jgi:hypothetical protein
MNSNSKKKLFTKKENKNDIMNFEIVNTTQSKFKIAEKEPVKPKNNGLTSQFNSKKIVKQLSYKILMSKKNLSQKELINNLKSFKNILKEKDQTIGKEVTVLGPSMNSINLSIDMNEDEIKQNKEKESSELKLNYRCIKMEYDNDELMKSQGNTIRNSICKRSSVINLFSEQEKSIQLAKDETKLERKNLLNRIRQWKATFKDIFDQGYSKYFFESKMKEIGSLPIKQRIYLRRGQLLLEREKDSEKIFNEMEILEKHQDNLSEVFKFCETWKDRKEISLFFQLKNQKFQFYRVKYNYMNSLNDFPKVQSPSSYKVRLDL